MRLATEASPAPGGHCALAPWTSVAAGGRRRTASRFAGRPETTLPRLGRPGTFIGAYGATAPRGSVIATPKSGARRQEEVTARAPGVGGIARA